ncbi:hypothetical protein ACS0TY_024010 [Phlomoides rotata]
MTCISESLKHGHGWGHVVSTFIQFPEALVEIRSKNSDSTCEAVCDDAEKGTHSTKNSTVFTSLPLAINWLRDSVRKTSLFAVRLSKTPFFFLGAIYLTGLGAKRCLETDAPLGTSSSITLSFKPAVNASGVVDSAAAPPFPSSAGASADFSASLAVGSVTFATSSPKSICFPPPTGPLGLKGSAPSADLSPLPPALSFLGGFLPFVASSSGSSCLSSE